MKLKMNSIKLKKQKKMQKKIEENVEEIEEKVYRAKEYTYSFKTFHGKKLLGKTFITVKLL